MLRQALIVTLVLSFFALPVAAQKSPPSLVDTDATLADSVLALRDAEIGLVKAIIARHRHAADVKMRQGDWQATAAEIALFANEGDNAVGGVRKRLLEGGHHFNAAGEEAGRFDEGFVIVTRAARKKCLELSAALRKASNDMEKKQLWDEFAKLSERLMK